MSNINKIAKFVLALGSENSSLILKHLDDETTELIASEILKIDKFDSNEKEAILKEFDQEIKRFKEYTIGGKEESIKILEKALGKKNAQKHIEKLNAIKDNKDVRRIEAYSVKSVFRVLDNELPQTIALILSYLKSQYAAKVLSQFELSKRANIAKKIANLTKINPQIFDIIVNKILKQLEAINDSEFDTESGEDKLSAILSYMDIQNEENILNNIQDDDPEMAQRIKEKLTTFEDLLNLHPAEIRRVVERIPDEETWATALKGAGDDILRHIMGSISINRASDITDEMQRIGAVRLKEIEKNRRYIIDVAEQLEREGKLFIHKDKEDLVD